MEILKIPDKWEYCIIKNEPPKNEFIELTKKHTKEIEDLIALNKWYTEPYPIKIEDSVFENVKDIKEKKYMKDIYMILNNLDVR